ncbi:MAG: HEPN domain-containing protein [Bryobacterales bacterium]|nr:HEPN domain-containing protein [Bryobacterales bacterium]
MPSAARKAFDENAKDIRRLLAIHTQLNRPTDTIALDLEVLNKSAIVLIVAFWESYCEDIAAEALAHIVEYSDLSEVLPENLKKQIATELRKHDHQLEVWRIADQGWKTYLGDRLEQLRETRNRRLNTPKTQNIDELFGSTLGIDRISNCWKWKSGLSCQESTNKLDDLVKLRGVIAHRGISHNKVTRRLVIDYFRFIKAMAARTGGRVNTHVKGITGVPLWE